MFTVSGRVINELVELTCAINFSLLFRFEARAQKSKTAEAFMVDGGKGKGREEHLNNNIASNLPPNDNHDPTTFLLML